MLFFRMVIIHSHDWEVDDEKVVRESERENQWSALMFLIRMMIIYSLIKNINYHHPNQIRMVIIYVVD